LVTQNTPFAVEDDVNAMVNMQFTICVAALIIQHLDELMFAQVDYFAFPQLMDSSAFPKEATLKFPVF
jgi:hypothetical protein